MKRIQLFEFEDQGWFPEWLRKCLTRLIVVVHRLLNSDDDLTALLTKVLTKTGATQIVDLCSGSGGPMISVIRKINKKKDLANINLILTDLYPNLSDASLINNTRNNSTYLVKPVNAVNVSESLKGVRTMVGSFHHMNPSIAKKILFSAQESSQPICIFEISDNSMPIFLWWVVIPVNFLMCLFITPMVRPMSWQQIVFTYLIPIIPLFFAWDGAVSNARTYTLNDLDELLSDIDNEGYIWKKGVIKGKSSKLYLIGTPAN
jgi:hypothetical protein